MRSSSSRTSSYTQGLELFARQIISLVLINFFNPLAPARTRGCLFCTFGYNPILNFVAPVVVALVPGGSSKLAPVAFPACSFIELFTVESTLTGGRPMNVSVMNLTRLFFPSLRGKSGSGGPGEGDILAVSFLQGRDRLVSDHPRTHREPQRKSMVRTEVS